MTMCQTCGRRPSERIGRPGGHETLHRCPDPIHDAADRALDAEALLEEAEAVLAGADAWIAKLATYPSKNAADSHNAIIALLQRLRARKQGER